MFYGELESAVAQNSLFVFSGDQSNQEIWKRVRHFISDQNRVVYVGAGRHLSDIGGIKNLGNVIIVTVPSGIRAAIKQLWWSRIKELAIFLSQSGESQSIGMKFLTRIPLPHIQHATIGAAWDEATLIHLNKWQVPKLLSLHLDSRPEHWIARDTLSYRLLFPFYFKIRFRYLCFSSFLQSEEWSRTPYLQQLHSSMMYMLQSE